MNFEIDNISGN